MPRIMGKPSMQTATRSLYRGAVEPLCRLSLRRDVFAMEPSLRLDYHVLEITIDRRLVAR